MQHLNILIIEQNHEELRKICDWLEEGKRYNLLSAATSEMALVIMQKKTLDLVVVDWETALSAKVDLFKYITQNKQFAQIPRIIVSSDTQFEKDYEHIKKRSKHFLSKPLKADTLHKKVEQVLNPPPPANPADSVDENQEAQYKTLQEALQKAQQTISKQEKELQSLQEKESLKLDAKEAEHSVKNEQQNQLLQEKDEALTQLKTQYKEVEHQLKLVQSNMHSQSAELQQAKEQIEVLQARLAAQASLPEQLSQENEALKMRLAEQEIAQNDLANAQNTHNSIINYILPQAWRERYQNDPKAQITLGEHLNLLLLTVDNYLLLKQLKPDLWKEWEQSFISIFNSYCQENQSEAIRPQSGVFMAIARHDEKYKASAAQILTLAQKCQSYIIDHSPEAFSPALQVNISLHSGSLLIGHIQGQRVVYDHWGSLTQKLPRPSASSEDKCLILLSESFQKTLPDKTQSEVVGSFKDRQFGILKVYQIVKKNTGD